MKNCLVTTLKGVVNNPELLPIGGMSFEVSSGDALKFQLYSIGSYELHLIGDAYFMNANTMSGYYNTNADDSRDIESFGNHDFAISAQSAKLIIVDKSYSITRFSSLGYGGFRLTVNDVSAFGFRESLQYLEIANTIVKGHIDNLSNLSTLKSVMLNNTTMLNVYSINIFDKCTGLEILLCGQNGTGTIESLVEHQAANRSQSSLSINTYNSKITFNGQLNTVNSRHTVDFDGNGGATVSFNGAVVGTYNGSTWTYA